MSQHENERYFMFSDEADPMSALATCLAKMNSEERPSSRRRVQVALKLRGRRADSEFMTSTYDLSESGAFVPLHELPDDPELLSEFEVGAPCTARLTVAPFLSFECKARVIRHSVAEGTYPAGFGLRFEGLTALQRRFLATQLLDPA